MALNPGNGQLFSYDTYQSTLRPLVLLVFVALQAPNLVSGDLRYHTLPLYFARPISRSDYPVAKLIGFTMACLAMVEIPLLILWVGTISQVHGASAVWHQTTEFGPGLLYGAACRAAGEHRAGAGVRYRQTGIRHLRGRGPVVRDLVPGHCAEPCRTADVPGRGCGPAARAGEPGRPDQPVHGDDRVADWLGSAPKIFFGRFSGGGGPIGRQAAPGRALRAPVRRHVRGMLAAAIGGLLVRYRKVGIA